MSSSSNLDTDTDTDGSATPSSPPRSPLSGMQSVRGYIDHITREDVDFIVHSICAEGACREFGKDAPRDAPAECVFRAMPWSNVYVHRRKHVGMGTVLVSMPRSDTRNHMRFPGVLHFCTRQRANVPATPLGSTDDLTQRIAAFVACLGWVEAHVDELATLADVLGQRSPYIAFPWAGAALGHETTSSWWIEEQSKLLPALKDFAERTEARIKVVLVRS